MKPTPPQGDGPRRPARSPLFDRMRAQHAYVLQALAVLERALAAAPAPGARSGIRIADLRVLVNELGRELAAHVSEEDEVLMPLLASGLPEGPGFVRGLVAEHAELRAMLVAFAATLDRPEGAQRDEQIGVQGGDLIALTRLQIRKEETLVFAIAERLIAPGAPAPRSSGRREAPPSRPHPTRGEPS
ncbi:MAG: hemerythrin domain-containing protein [Candidatus Eisenbacteria bacterium]